MGSNGGLVGFNLMGVLMGVMGGVGVSGVWERNEAGEGGRSRMLQKLKRLMLEMTAESKRHRRAERS